MMPLKLLAFFLTLAAGFAQTPRLTFEVASIHPSEPGGRGGGIKALPGGQEYTSRGVPVKLIISLMFKVPMRQITGGPSWMDSQPWDIEAKADKSYNLDDLHTMFQNLLFDEFKLKFHKEIKEGPVYALTIDKSGLKMKPNTTEQDFKIPIEGGRGKSVGTRVPMEYLTWWLSQMLQADARPVIDKTGLTGYWDFTLSFLPPLPPGVDLDKLPPEMRDLPTIFEALKSEAGLRLDPQKGPVEYYVIDRLEKPSSN